MKKEISLVNAQWLLEPGCVVLITAGNMEKYNVMTISWQTPVNPSSPTLILLTIHQQRYTYQLIKNNQELVINIPDKNLVSQVHFCGSISGKKLNKITKCGFTLLPASKVAPPLIAECIAHLECQVIKNFPLHPHHLLICEVLSAQAEESLFSDHWLPEKSETLHYLGKGRYAVIGKQIKADISRFLKD